MKKHHGVFVLISRFFLYFFLGLMPFLGGCAAAIPVSLVAEGADAGVELATGNARSFTYPRAQVHAASIQALDVMRIRITKDHTDDDKISLHGKTKNLNVFLTLTTITPALTKASVKVKKNGIVKDSTKERASY